MAIGTTTALILGAAAAATAGATAYSGHQQAKAAETAANVQREVGLKQIEAVGQAERQAAETAKSQLKLKQASRSKTILSAPSDLTLTGDVNKPTILGV